MCVVSMVGDHYGQKFAPLVSPGSGDMSQMFTQISRVEFDELKRQVLEMKDLLVKAKEIDEKTGQPDCEQPDKVKLLKQIAELVGVDLSEVFK